SLLAALVLDEGIVAARVLEGSYTHETFYEFLCDDLLLLKNPYPAPKSVILLDNAWVHHSPEVVELIEGYSKSIT
ncbi:hypothetical protein PAXRUDRAFT_148336, partial [Paxillus rubicundulus Ve08.2h10]